MKVTSKLIAMLSIAALFNCQPKSDNPEISDPVEINDLELLEKEVMKVHDEVMPKMNDMYALKRTLTEKLGDSSSLAEDKKEAIKRAISRLDSASEQMMVWMRQYNPSPDSLSEERNREYLENEMEKVKKVREDILTALEKANREK